MAMLSEWQCLIVIFVDSFIREHGRPPTHREISAHIGVRSLNFVHLQLRLLEKKGFIRHDHHGMYVLNSLRGHGSHAVEE